MQYCNEEGGYSDFEPRNTPKNTKTFGAVRQFATHFLATEFAENAENFCITNFKVSKMAKMSKLQDFEKHI